MLRIVPLMLIILQLATTQCTQRETPPPSPAESSFHLFIEGCVAGMLATNIVNIARNHILPDATALQLYRRFGICRDQLAGSIKSLVALLIIAARRPVSSRYATATLKATVTRLIGIAVGVHGMAYLHHSMDH